MGRKIEFLSIEKKCVSEIMREERNAKCEMKRHFGGRKKGRRLREQELWQ